MYWDCARADEAAATRIASAKIGSLWKLLIEFLHCCRFGIGKGIMPVPRSGARGHSLAAARAPAIAEYH